MTASIIRGRRQDRERITAFDSLVATPHDLASGPLVMPSSARLALSHSAGLTAGQVTISIVTGRVGFTHPALAADVVYRGSWAEKGTRISQSGSPAGTLKIWLVNPLDGTLETIATQVVA